MKINFLNKVENYFSLSDKGTRESCPLFILLHCLFSYGENGCECLIFVGEGRLNGKGGEIE